VRFPSAPRAVIFDLDGLLIDSVPAYASAMIVAAGDVGCTISREYVLTLVGLLGTELRTRIAADLGASFPLSAFFDAMGVRLQEVLGQAVPLKPGAVELVKELSARQVPLAVATSLTRPEAERHLLRTGLRAYFRALATRDDVARSKPHPDVYREAASRLQVDVHHCVALEDSYSGIRSAKAAGAMPIMVPDVLPPTAEMAEHCLWIAEDLVQVQSLLAGMGVDQTAPAVTQDRAHR
jgi:HAD superfamily hydrolase (TIGR01509 family)